MQGGAFFWKISRGDGAKRWAIHGAKINKYITITHHSNNRHRHQSRVRLRNCQSHILALQHNGYQGHNRPLHDGTG